MQQHDQDDQKRLLLAVALSAGVLAVWGLLSPKPPPVDPAPDPAAASAPAAESAKAAAPEPAAATATPIERRVLGTLTADGLQQVEFTNEGQLGTWVLLESQYAVRVQGEADTPYTVATDFDAAQKQGRVLPPRLDLSLSGAPAGGAYSGQGEGNTARLRWTDPKSGVQVERVLALNADAYTVSQTITLTNPGATEVPYDLTAVLRAAQNDTEATGSIFMPPLYKFEAVCQRTEDFERSPIEAVTEARSDPDEPTTFKDVGWAGVDSRYFMTAALPAKPDEVEGCTFDVGAGPAGVTATEPFSFVTTRLDLTGGTIPAGGSVSRTVTFYAGPKKLDVLEAQAPKLDQAIDFGVFTVICRPMLWLMRTFFGMTGNWGFAIILLTLLVKVLTFPLTHKQYKSMAAMKVLQPEMKALQEKYKDDKPKQQQELMKLYREHKVNPLAGCLPLVLMMPIYFSLYRTIYSAVELYQAPFFGWLTDLSAQDPFYITPLALGVLMFVQMRLNPSAGGDQMQQKVIMWVMPFMFTGMMLFLPSGLVVYIFVNTVLGIAQQYYLLKNTAPAPGAASRAKA